MAVVQGLDTERKMKDLMMQIINIHFLEVAVRGKY